MKLFEEFKLYENMWEAENKTAYSEETTSVPKATPAYTDAYTKVKNLKTLEESLDFMATLKNSEVINAPWYTEYFAVGPSVCDKATDEVLTPENFDDYWEDFEAAMDDSTSYEIMPIVFGPNGARTYSKKKHATLEEALDNVIENLYTDSDLSDIASYDDLFEMAMMEPAITDNSVTFIIAYGPDVQDTYGCYVRVSQKPLNSNKRLGQYYLQKSAKSGPHLLADMMDTGLVGEEYSSYPNFSKGRYAWQAK